MWEPIDYASMLKNARKSSQNSQTTKLSSVKRKNVSPQNVYNLLQNYSDQGMSATLMLIDLRRVSDFEQGHIRGARNVTEFGAIRTLRQQFQSRTDRRMDVLLYTYAAITLPIQGTSQEAAESASSTTNCGPQDCYSKEMVEHFLKMQEEGLLRSIFFMNTGYTEFNYRYPFLCLTASEESHTAAFTSAYMSYPLEVFRKRLYMGAWVHATNTAILRRLDIRTVIDLTTNGIFMQQQGLIHRIEILHYNEASTTDLPLIVKALHERLEAGLLSARQTPSGQTNPTYPILIACNDGNTTSPYVLSGYLMYSRKWDDYYKVLTYLMSIKPDMHISAQQFSMLCKYIKRLSTLSSSALLNASDQAKHSSQASTELPPSNNSAIETNRIADTLSNLRVTPSDTRASTNLYHMPIAPITISAVYSEALYRSLERHLLSQLLEEGPPLDYTHPIYAERSFFCSDRIVYRGSACEVSDIRRFVSYLFGIDVSIHEEVDTEGLPSALEMMQLWRTLCHFVEGCCWVKTNDHHFINILHFESSGANKISIQKLFTVSKHLIKNLVVSINEFASVYLQHSKQHMEESLCYALSTIFLNVVMYISKLHALVADVSDISICNCVLQQLLLFIPIVMNVKLDEIQQPRLVEEEMALSSQSDYIGGLRYLLVALYAGFLQPIREPGGDTQGWPNLCRWSKEWLQLAQHDKQCFAAIDSFSDYWFSIYPLDIKRILYESVAYNEVDGLPNDFGDILRPFNTLLNTTDE